MKKFISSNHKIVVLSLLYTIAYLFNFSCSDKSTEQDDDGNNYSQVDTVFDIDGNAYQTVIIGDQVWMAENLKVTHFCNDDPIPVITDTNEWAGLSSPACCGYANSDSIVEIYGLLYNWYAVSDIQKV